MLADRWQKVEELFHAALDCGPEARAALLDANCAGDPDLRAEVELLLANEAQAGGLLDSPSTATLDFPLEAKAPLVGRTFGAYTFLSTPNSAATWRSRPCPSSSRAMPNAWPGCGARPAPSPR